MLDPSEVPLSEACHLYSVCSVPPPCSLPSTHPQISGAGIPGWQACSSSLSLFSHHLHEADGKEKPAEQLRSRPQCLGATFSWDIRPRALGLLIQKMLSECPAHRKSISTICENLSHNENHHPFLGTHVHAPWECLVFCCHLSVAVDPSIQVGIELSMPLCGDAVKLLWFFLGKWIM